MSRHGSWLVAAVLLLERFLTNLGLVGDGIDAVSVMSNNLPIEQMVRYVSTRKGFLKSQ